MSVSRFEKYHAVGSGADFALGALHALYPGRLGVSQLARRAVAAATHFNIYCGGETDVVTLKAKG